MTTAEVLALLSQAGGAILSFAVLTLLPAALRIAGDKRNQAVFASVTRAAKIGALAAAREVNHALERAAAADSPSGKEITPQEIKSAIADGVVAARNAIKAQAPALLDEAIRLYGGTEELDRRLNTLVATMADEHTAKP